MLLTQSERPQDLSTRRSNLARTPIVVVLGMHRSGTSLCSQVLSLLGIDMADDIGRSSGNPAGHWERWEIVEFHDRVLRLLDRDYWSGTHDFALPSGWWAQPEIRAIQRELEGFIRTRMRPGHPFGFKDPRTARLLPLWIPIFRALNLDPKFVFCVRSPSQVARSLNDRDGLPLPTGEYRWAVYNAECWRNLRAEACTIDFDSWFTDRDRPLDRLLAFLSDMVDVDRALIAQALEDRIDRSLRHDGSASTSARHPALRYFYALLSRPEQNDETRGAIARFVEQFAAFQQITPFEGSVKAAADRDAAQAAAQECTRALEAAQAEHDAELTVLRSSVDEVRNELQAARQEVAEWRAHHDAAVQSLDEAVAAAGRHAEAAEAARQESQACRAEYASMVQARDEAIAEASRQAADSEAVRQETAALRARQIAALQTRDEAVAEAARQAADSEAVRQETAALRAQQIAALKARDEAVAEVERYAADLEAARRNSETWRAQHAAAVQARDEAAAEIVRNAAAMADAEAEIRRLQEAYTDLQRWSVSFQSGIASSWSWRLTRPLRRLGFARAVLPSRPDQPDP